MTGERIAVIGGGTSPEHDVSLASAAAIGRALGAAGYAVEALTIGRDGDWLDAEGRPIGLPDAVAALQGCAAALPALHGPHGEDGTLAALCDLARVPVVGSPLAAGALAMSKWATKLVAEAVGVRTAPGVLLDSPGAALGVLSADELPLVVKPVSSGSSHGVARVRTEAELASAVSAAFALDDRVLVEQVVTGREVDVAVLRRPDGSHLVAPALEILLPGESVFGLAAKYDGSARFAVPAPLTDVERKALEQAAVTVYAALGCAGVARVDFFLTDDGPVLNEVNTMPGFTEQSQVPRMFAAMGLSYPALLDLLVRDVLDSAPAA